MRIYAKTFQEKDQEKIPYVPNTGSGRSEAYWSAVGRVIICSFNLNISPEMSYGALEGDIVMLQNHMLMIL